MLSKNIKETKKIAKLFLNKLLKDKKESKKALVVGLSGNLGSGKTAFTKLVAKHLGIKDKVFSPTYVIFKKYPIKNFGQFKYFFHMDAYRLEGDKELKNLKWKEIIKNKENLVFVEWPENIIKGMPKDSKFVFISDNHKKQRNFKFKI